MAEKLAEQGWLVRVETKDAAAVMDFAVGKNSSREAIVAVLDHPAIEAWDQVTWTDQLTLTEISVIRSVHIRTRRLQAHAP